MEKALSLDEALEKWAVHVPGMWHNDQGPLDWCAVSNDDDGIVAYFYNEVDAARYRLFMVNLECNPISGGE